MCFFYFDITFNVRFPLQFSMRCQTLLFEYRVPLRCRDSLVPKNRRSTNRPKRKTYTIQIRNNCKSLAIPTIPFQPKCNLRFFFVLLYLAFPYTRRQSSTTFRQRTANCIFERFLQSVAVFYFDIIGRRHIVIRKPFVAIGIRGDYQFSATFFLIQNAARTVYDKLGCARNVICFVHNGRGNARADWTHIKQKFFPVDFKQINIDVSVCRCRVTYGVAFVFFQKHCQNVP